MESIKTIRKGNFVGRIHIDHDATSPREWDNFSIVACLSEYKKLADKGTPTAKLSEDLLKEVEALDPLYIKEIWVNGDFIGYAYVTPVKAKAEGIQDPAKIAEVVQAEVQTYVRYLSGETYGYTITEEEEGEDEKGPYKLTRDVESCWSFIGFEVVEEELKSALDNL
jgi:hypothetical protein